MLGGLLVPLLDGMAVLDHSILGLGFRGLGGYGIMENKMEATIMGSILGKYKGILLGFIGIMEKKMETTIVQ